MTFDNSSPVALTIAGSDPSGGAGLQADLKTFHQHGVYGMSVVTLLTVQNTKSVKAVRLTDTQLTLAQLETVLEDIPPNAAKTGALGNEEIIEALSERLSSLSFPLVVDPVMISKHGAPLLSEKGVQALTERLLPLAFLVTPNTLEAEALSGIAVRDLVSMERAAREIQRRGAKNVLIKGGHLDSAPSDSPESPVPVKEFPVTDLLLTGNDVAFFSGQRFETKNTHGTGCVLSAAITARLARGLELPLAVSGAKQFISAAIESNPNLGHGHGPVNLFADPKL